MKNQANSNNKQQQSLFALTNTKINAISGAFSGVVVAVAMSPLDVVRVRLTVHQTAQVFPHVVAGKFTAAAAHNKSGLTHVLKNMIKYEGFSSLYKGLGTTMLGYVPNWAIYFAVYEWSKKHMKQYTSTAFYQNVWSSCFAGAVTSILTSPIWVVKIRLQSQIGSTGYKGKIFCTCIHLSIILGIIHAFQSIIREEGFLALYRGLLPSMFGLLHVVIQFSLYEHLKQELRAQRNNNQQQTSAAASSSSFLFGQILIASCVSKMVASVAAYPHEVLRNRMQEYGHAERSIMAAAARNQQHHHHHPSAIPQPHHSNSNNATSIERAVQQDTIHHDATVEQQLRQHHERHYNRLQSAIHTIYKSEGIKGFYRGMGANLLRVVPAATLTLLSFEWCHDWLTKYAARSKKE